MPQSSNIIILYDRIKELSRTESTGPMVLDGAATGFSSFGSAYPHSGLMYYAITDGVQYEIGSGQYEQAGQVGADETVVSSNQIRRYPFRSTNSNVAVNWTAGTKEVYVTYPAPQSVYTGSGVSPHFNTPVSSGIPYWESANILNYDSSFIWDSTNNRLGVSTSTPAYALDIGGHGEYSIMRASGAVVGSSGVQFPSGNTLNTGWDSLRYIGGTQLEHFSRNELDVTTGTDDVFQLSGIVDQVLELKKQKAGTVFAGPASGCDLVDPGCTPAYPSFRALAIKDIPDLSDIYVTEKGHANKHSDGSEYAKSSGVAIWHLDNVIAYDAGLIFDSGNNRLGIGVLNPSYNLDVVGNVNITTDAVVGNDLIVKTDAEVGNDLLVGNDLTVKGDLDIWGGTTYIDSTTVTVGDKQLELASLSGTTPYAESLVDTAGIVIKASGTAGVQRDKEWIWRNATNAWTSTSGNIDVSGIVGLTAGSGLELTRNANAQNLALHVTDLFSLGSSPTQTISQGETVFVSGINGVATSMGSFPAEATATVTITDFTELNSTDKVNLIATDGTNYDFVNGDQSSVAGTWESATSNDQTATNLMNVINTSSGPAGTRFSASVVGAVVTITQNTGGPDGNTAITLTDADSVGMTKRDFTGGTNRTHTVYVDPTELSGILSNAMMNGFDVASQYNGTTEAATVNDTEQIAFSGSQGVVTDYVADGVSNHILHFTAPDIATASGALHLDMIASGVAVSGYALALDTAANLKMIASGVAVSGYAEAYADSLGAGDMTSWSLKGQEYGTTTYSDTVQDGETVTFSGIDGVSIYTGVAAWDAPNHRIRFSAPGIAQNTASGVAISGYALALDTAANLKMIASGVAVSGYADALDTAANLKMIASGVAVSGYAKAYTDEAMFSAGSMTSWTLESQGATDEEATVSEANQVAFSGDHGIVSDYIAEGPNHKITFSAPNIVNNTASGVAVSGYAEALVLSTGVAANAYADTQVAAENLKMIASGVAVSGYADALVLSTGVAANAYTDTRVAATGAAANLTMIASGVAVSGYADALVLSTGVAANAYTDTQVTAENLKMIASGVAVSGFSVAYTNAAVLDAGSFTHWQISDDDATHYTVNQTTPKVNFLGADGVTTTYASDVHHDITIAAPDIATASGALHLDMIASGVAVSGYAKAYSEALDTAANLTMIASGVAVSGYADALDTAANLTMIASGVAVSGYAKAYAETLDTAANLTMIASGVAVSGYAKAYAESLDTAANLTMIASGVAVSGYAKAYTDAVDAAANLTMIASGVAVSGYADALDTAANLKMIASGVAVSGFAVAYADSKTAYTAGSGLTRIGTGPYEFGLDIKPNRGLEIESRSSTSNPTAESDSQLAINDKWLINNETSYNTQLGYFDDTSLGIDYTATNTRTIAIGKGAGYKLGALTAQANEYITIIGAAAGYNATGIRGSNIVGSFAAQGAHSGVTSNALGNYAMWYGSGLNFVQAIGNQAVYLGSGIDSSSFIGDKAGYASSGIYFTSAVGHKALRDSHNITNSYFVGTSAGASAKNVIASVAIGHDAGRQMHDAVNNVAIGRNAGWQNVENTGVLMVGEHSGKEASGISYSTALGTQAMEKASGCNHSVTLGYKAAWYGHQLDNVIMVGKAAGHRSKHSRRSIMIGYQAGYDFNYNTGSFDPAFNLADNTDNDNIFIGNDCGYRSYGVNNSVFIGNSAGKTVEKSDNHVFIGSEAGQWFGGGLFLGAIRISDHEGGQEGTSNDGICIGSQAGKSAMSQDRSVFIGYRAGYYAASNASLHAVSEGSAGHNISIISPADGIDYVHTDDVLQTGVFNFANCIAGRSKGVFSGTQRVVIGQVSPSLASAPEAVVHIKPNNTNSMCLYTDKANGGIGAPAIASYSTTNFAPRVSTSQKPAYEAIGDNKNIIVNKYGYISLPMFATFAHAKAALGNITDTCGSFAMAYGHGTWFYITKIHTGKWQRQTAGLVAEGDLD